MKPESWLPCLLDRSVGLVLLQLNPVNFLTRNNFNIRVSINHFAGRFVWVWNLVADIKGGNEAEGVWEYGVEENIWT